MTLGTYFEHFRNLIEVIEYCGGRVGYDPGVYTDYLERNGLDESQFTKDEVIKHKATAVQKYVATVFILRADRSRYRKLIEDVENDNLKGRDDYPRTIHDSYSILSYWTSIA
jgi:hypothetical protein